MKILQLCNKFPFPLKDGAAIASTFLARALTTLGHEVSLLSMNTGKHWFDLDKLPSDFNHYRNIYTVFIDNRVKPADAMLNLISGESYHVSRFVSSRFRSELKKILERSDYDAVILETVFVAPYIETIRAISPRTLVILRAHNV
ncbi:MAG: glycosyl transferase family 1, partial [Bacteroidota bacterium]